MVIAPNEDRSRRTRDGSTADHVAGLEREAGMTEAATTNTSQPALAPVRPDYLVFGSPQILEPEIDEIVATLRSAWIGTGPRTASFEAAFAEYVGAPHAVALNSCTAALHLALVTMGLEAGDEVIVPSLTFASTANAVVHAGGRPVLADVDQATMCLDPDDLRRRITPRTRAIVPVHFAGRACAMEEISALAHHYGLSVVEDCAHAVETVSHGAHAGTLGSCGAFSFYATKNVVTGEGGMLVTADPSLAARVKTLALHGLSADAWTRFSDRGFRHYEVREPGFKYNMTDMQAALGIHQLARVEPNLQRRKDIWSRYDASFADLPVWTPTREEDDTRHARHLYTLMLDIDQLAVSRDEVMSALHDQNIGTGLHYRPVHLHEYYRKQFGYQRGDLPTSEWIGNRSLSLPLSPKLTDGDVDDVVVAVRRTLEHFAR
jgi:dTDP-4-amino-4,6-dideoxygalactose transaminase